MLKSEIQLMFCRLSSVKGNPQKKIPQGVKGWGQKQLRTAWYARNSWNLDLSPQLPALPKGPVAVRDSM